jgi:cobyric acid synthase
MVFSIMQILLRHSKVFNHKVVDYETFKEEQYDKLAALIRANVDLEAIYSFLV